MGRRRDKPVRDSGPGPFANDNQVLPCPASAFPRDAQALIEPAPGAVYQRGKARAGQWRIRFLPRWAPVAEPLMGWSGGGDPLEQIELRFPDPQAAVAYCKRQGLSCFVHGHVRTRPSFPATSRGFTVRSDVGSEAWTLSAPRTPPFGRTGYRNAALALSIARRSPCIRERTKIENHESSRKGGQRAARAKAPKSVQPPPRKAGKLAENKGTLDRFYPM